MFPRPDEGADLTHMQKEIKIEADKEKRRKKTLVKELDVSEAEQEEENSAVEIKGSNDEMIDIRECAKILSIETD